LKKKKGTTYLLQCPVVGLIDGCKADIIELCLYNHGTLPRLTLVFVDVVCLTGVIL
jgi:hypothetical protein